MASTKSLAPSDAAFLADPYPAYRRLREREPVHFHKATETWWLTRYDDITAVLADPRMVKGPLIAERIRRLPLMMRGLARRHLGRAGLSMLNQDPPDHGRLRSLVSKAFTPRAIERLRPSIQQITDDLLDQAAGDGEVDVMARLAAPLPVAVIGALLGLPAKDSEKLRLWSNAIADRVGAGTVATNARALRAVTALRRYLAPVVNERRKRPGEDILSGLIHAEEAGDHLTTEELYANLTLLLIAGHETTTNLIGNGLLALLRHPAEYERLRREPDRIASAVEELLRFDSPVQRVARIGQADVTVGGVLIPAGQLVRLELGAANRDPARFEHPDTLDIGRTDVRHLSFSHGPHFCLGAALARLEGQIALSTLVRRYPAMRLATDRPVWRPSPTLRGLAALPVRLVA